VKQGGFWNFKVKLKKIKLNNIRSYEKNKIVFPEGSTLLSGDIGSGKTSILLGIEFGLFGLQPGQRGSSILRNGCDSGGVEINFEVDGTEIIIERTLKRGSKSISQDYSAITIDGQKRELAITELKNLVLELLNYPKEFSKKQNILYKFTVYTPQEEMKQIILQDSETRINTLRHVFGIDKYKRIIENTSLVLTKIREEKRVKEALVSNIDEEKKNLLEKESELESKKQGLFELNSQLIEKRSAKENLQRELDEVSKKIEEKNKLQQEVEKTKIMISNKENQINENRNRMEDLRKQMEEFGKIDFEESRIDLIESKIKSLKEKRILLNDNNLDISSKISSLKMKNKDSEMLKQKISRIDVCPTCLQDVDSVYKSNVSNKIDSDVSENINKIKELEIEKQNLSSELNKIEYDISQNEKEVQELKLMKVKLQSVEEKKVYINSLEKQINILNGDLNMLKTHVDSVKNSIFEISKYDNLFREKQRVLEESAREEKMAEIRVAENRREVEVFSKQIDELRVRIDKTQEILKEIIYLANLEDWISKKFLPVISFVEKNVLVKLKSEFSKLFSEWFSMLVADNFHVRLKDDFTPIIEQHDYEIDYNYLSGGERTAIALAYRLSLNQVINSLLSQIKTKDLVILDEPTDGFSSAQLDKMREVLNELNVAQLIIVSHEQKIEGFVDNVIRFKKENGISGMVE